MQKKSTFWFLCLLATAAVAHAQTVTNADVTDTLNLGSSWVGNTAPGSGNVAVWNNIVQVNTTKTLGANVSWGGIQIIDPAGAVTINTNSSGNVLTLGASGIDMSLATASFNLGTVVSLNGNQTWNIGTGLTLTESGGITGSGILTKSGAGTLVSSAASTYSGGTVVNGGVFQINIGTGAGTGPITNNNGATLRINTSTSLANPLNFSGTVTVDQNNFANNEGFIGSSISGSGTVNFINQNGVAPGRVFTLGGSSSSLANFSGTFNFGTNSGVYRFNDGGGSGNTGSSSATFNLGTGSAVFFTRNRGAAVNMGAVFGGPNTTITNGTSSSGTSTYSIGGANIPCQFDGIIADASSTAAVAINKVGTSTLTLTGTNNYRGTTTISAGTLIVGTGGTTGQVGNGAIVNNAALVYNRSDSPTIANAISGSGTLSQMGAGMLIFSGTNTSSGTLAVSNGAVALTASGLIQAPIYLASGTWIDISTNPAFAFNQTLAGFGGIVGAATNIGGTISPGGLNAAGTLTFSNGLAETGNVNHQLELSTVGSTNDLVSVIGDLTVSGTNTIVLSKFGGGTIPNGLYPLFAYSGNFNGGLTNFSVSASGVSATLTNPPNEIAVIITPPARGVTNLTWIGDGAANAWDTASSNWVNGATSFNFQSGDSVRFDATGAANSTVTLGASGLLLPAAVVVDAANNYTFIGNGIISGNTGLTKTNIGTLSVQTTNSYNGPTIVGGGTLEISSIANGNSPSAIGQSSSSPTNLVLINSALRYTGSSASTDRGATLSGTNDTLEIPGGTLTFTTTPLTGPATLTKFGTGTLTLNVPDTYTGGTVVSNGVLALGSNLANNDGSGGSALGASTNPVVFFGGTLQLFGYSGSTGNNYSTLYNPLVVPAGQVGTLRLFPRGPSNSGGSSGLASSLSGAGTLNLVINYVRDNIDGNWSAFTGTINVTPKNTSGDEFRINNNFGYSNAVIVLNDNVLMNRATAPNTTVDIGELDGTSLAVLGVSTLPGTNTTWRIGWKNTSSTFDGTISDGGAANFNNIVKVGSGTWTLTGNNTYAGNTTVSTGTLALNGSGTISASSVIDVQAGAFLDVSTLSTPTLSLNSGQTLIGKGTVTGSVDSGNGGVIAPGEPTGTLNVTTSASLGGTTRISIDRAATPNVSRLAAPSINLANGTLIVTNVGGRLQVGDTFTLFSGTPSGSFGSVTLPGYYTWDTSSLNSSGTISVTAVLPPPAITNVDFSTISSGSITVNAINGLPNGPVNVLTSTNLLSAWTVYTSTSFDGSGNLNTPVTVDPAAPQFYIKLQAQ